jgi:hypothetical protein
MLILPSKSLDTCSDVVGLGLPEIFADGAAIGTPVSCINVCAILFSGILTATVLIPPVVIFGTIFDFLSTNVSGPGQNLLINSCAVFGI